MFLEEIAAISGEFDVNTIFHSRVLKRSFFEGEQVWERGEGGCRGIRPFCWGSLRRAGPRKLWQGSQKVLGNRKPHTACVQVYYFNSSTDLPKGDISSQCEATSAPCPARQPQIVEQHMFFLLNLVPQRWASAELTLHEEGSMFGSAIASSQSDKGEVSEAKFANFSYILLIKGGLLVAVAADSSSLGARMAGSVYIYYL